MGNNPSSIYIAIGATVGGMVLVTVGGVAFLVTLLRRISHSVGVAPPTSDMTQKEDASRKCALFRHFPHLASKLAWRSLGAADASPIHICQIPTQSNPKRTVKFWVKREDLISPLYGGNKVRTLQHQLAVCESKREAGQEAYRHLVSLGSGGSNQVLATTVHARALGWDNASTTKSQPNNSLTPCWFDKDEPDLDNTLNMLSVFSFSMPTTYYYDWGSKMGLTGTLRGLHAAWTQTTCIPMFLGGNCPVAVLGQIGGVLELAEQIQEGTSPDIDRIYLPLGSGCTTAGLCLGVVLARHLGLKKSFQNPNFTIVAGNVHDGFATMDRLLNLHTNPAFGFMPLTLSYTIMNACRALKEIGGPDVEQEALAFIREHVDIRSDAKVVGKYGCHSDITREMAQWYDEHGQITDAKTGTKAKELWVCGHFVAKALQPLLQDLEALPETDTNPNYMLWMTKSAIQPKGPQDEWVVFEQVNDAVKKWADNGKAESPKYRPGSTHKPEEYRSIMTPIA